MQECTPNRTEHDINCEWQFEQYPWDCNCGVTAPRAPWFVPYEDSATVKHSWKERLGGHTMRCERCGGYLMLGDSPDMDTCFSPSSAPSPPPTLTLLEEALKVSHFDRLDRQHKPGPPSRVLP